ncbi:MAG: hypothetical protein Q7S89_01595 [bacterium]|nr:hypothetical protein [bacterium]
MMHLPIHKAEILKSSDAYLIFICEEGGEKFVYKIAHENHGKLDKEVARIRELAVTYPRLSVRLPIIHDHGTIESGPHAGKRYYVQSYFSGNTFSHHLQSSFTSASAVRDIFGTILRTLVDISFEHVPNTVYDRRGGDFYREAFMREFDRLRVLPNLSYLASQEYVTINGERYPSLRTLLDRIGTSSALAALQERPSFIASLGHWNFHGDNIIINDIQLSDRFKVIDPDVSIDENDPLYGIARFLYSFPHDTAEYEQYLIHSPVFVHSPAIEPVYEIRSLWPEVVHRNYAGMFASVFATGDDGIAARDTRFADPMTLVRLKLALLYCLVRGVNANYEETIEFIEGRMTEFRHKSTLLYLHAVLFADRLHRELV